MNAPSGRATYAAKTTKRMMLEVRGTFSAPQALGPGYRAIIVLRAEHGGAWSFEVSPMPCADTPYPLSTRATSLHTFTALADAQAAAEHMARALLSCPRGAG